MKKVLFLFCLSLLTLAGCDKDNTPVEQKYDIYVLGTTTNTSSIAQTFQLWKNGEFLRSVPRNSVPGKKYCDLLVLPNGAVYVVYLDGKAAIVDDGECQYYIKNVSQISPMLGFSSEKGVCYFDSNTRMYQSFDLQGNIVKDFPKERLSSVATLPFVCTFDGTHAYYVYTEVTPSPEYYYKTWLNIDGEDVSSFLSDTPQYIAQPTLITTNGKDVYFILFERSRQIPWLMKNNKPVAGFDDSISKYSMHAIAADDNNAYLLGSFSKRLYVWKNREPLLDLGSTDTYTSKKNQIFVLDGHVFTQISGQNGYVAIDGEKIYDLPTYGECFFVVRK